MKGNSSLCRQTGFGAVAAIMVLVILAALAAAMTRFGSVQHMTSAQDVLAIRAQAAARAGLEWGLYRTLGVGWCASDNLDLMADTGFVASVSCVESVEYREGESAVGVPVRLTIYTLTVTACNMPSSGACPRTDAIVAGPAYVERVLQVAVSK